MDSQGDFQAGVNQQLVEFTGVPKGILSKYSGDSRDVHRPADGPRGGVRTAHIPGTLATCDLRCRLRYGRNHRGVLDTLPSRKSSSHTHQKDIDTLGARWHDACAIGNRDDAPG